MKRIIKIYSLIAMLCFMGTGSLYAFQFGELKAKAVGMKVGEKIGEGKVYIKKYSELQDDELQEPNSTDYQDEYTIGEAEEDYEYDVYFYAKAEEGSTFEGWYKDETCIGTPFSMDNPYIRAYVYAEGSKPQDQEGLTLYAKFIPIIETKQLTDFVLKDGDAYELVYDANVTNFTYTRTFGGTNWTTWFVPFELELTDEICAKYDFSRINNVHQYDDDNDGTADRTVIESFRQKSGKTLKASYPYLVRAKSDADKDMELTLTDVHLLYAKDNFIDCQSMDHMYTFTGTYAGKDYGEGASTEYSLFDDYASWTRFHKLEPQRHYMTITPLNATSPNNAPRRIELKVTGEEDLTGIDQIENSKLKIENSKFIENGGIVIVKNGKKYNINGQILK